MCDFSLQNVRSRPAKVGDKLVTRDFGTGTRGFAAWTIRIGGLRAAGNGAGLRRRRCVPAGRPARMEDQDNQPPNRHLSSGQQGQVGGASRRARISRWAHRAADVCCAKVRRRPCCNCRRSRRRRKRRANRNASASSAELRFVNRNNKKPAAGNGGRCFYDSGRMSAVIGAKGPLRSARPRQLVATGDVSAKQRTPVSIIFRLSETRRRLSSPNIFIHSPNHS